MGPPVSPLPFLLPVWLLRWPGGKAHLDWLEECFSALHFLNALAVIWIVVALRCPFSCGVWLCEKRERENVSDRAFALWAEKSRFSPCVGLGPFVLCFCW